MPSLDGHYAHIQGTQLYLGDLEAASSEGLLRGLEVTHVVDASNTQAIALRTPGLAYCDVNVADTTDTDLSVHFPRVLEFVDQALSHPSAKVMIHCNQGISRSITLVLACMIHISQSSAARMTPDEALAHVRKFRPQAKPNAGFWKQLCTYHASVCEGPLPEYSFEYAEYFMDGMQIEKPR